MSQTITFYPLGNAETVLLELSNGKKLLFDYANMNSGKADDKRYKIANEFKRHKEFDVVMFSHSHEDHVQGAGAFFWFDHADKYQSNDRIKIKELWVSSAFILDSDSEDNELCEDARIIRQEARYRLRKGYGLKVFSKADGLDNWLSSQGLSTDDSKYPIYHAGTLLKGTSSWLSEEIQFFIHAPFSADADDVEDRNDPSIVMQVRLFNNEKVYPYNRRATNIFITGDTPHSVLEKVVDFSEANGNAEYLKWDIYDIPHHCSHTGLADESGADRSDSTTQPTKQVKKLIKDYASTNGLFVASCASFSSGSKPPCIHAKKAYIAFGGSDKRFFATMDYPDFNSSAPKPLSITIDHTGLSVDRTKTDSLVSNPAPRAGK